MQASAAGDQFVAMVKASQLDVSALALDNTPYLDQRRLGADDPLDLGRGLAAHSTSRQVFRMMSTDFPAPVRFSCSIEEFVVSRAGINNDLGGAPQHPPSAFWWKMPDGRRMFWLGIPYSEGYYYFHPSGGGAGRSQRLAIVYRPPTPNELLPIDDGESLRTQHSYLLTKLQQQIARGYHYPVFILPFTNQWRIDNDPPYSSVTEFVAAWNHAGLTPTLRLATATVATQKMEEIAGGEIPEYSGEFTDWWADGSMSSPAAMSASRAAKRYLRQAVSPLFGPTQPNAEKRITELQRELVVFDEHSWGYGMSIGLPYSLDTQGRLCLRRACMPTVQRWPRHNGCWVKESAPHSVIKERVSTSSIRLLVPGADEFPIFRLCFLRGDYDLLTMLLPEHVVRIEFD